MAACLARGTTVIKHASMEPEVVERLGPRLRRFRSWLRRRGGYNHRGGLWQARRPCGCWAGCATPGECCQQYRAVDQADH